MKSSTPGAAGCPLEVPALPSSKPPAVVAWRSLQDPCVAPSTYRYLLGVRGSGMGGYSLAT